MKSFCVALYMLSFAGLMTAVPVLAQHSDIYSRPKQSERSHDFDVLHYKIQLTFEEKTRSFSGRTAVTLRSLRDGFDEVRLDAASFVVTGVTDTEDHALPFSHENESLQIRMRSPRAYNDTLTVLISYEAHNYAVDPPSYGMPASYALGLDFKPATDTNPQLINTLSFPEGARHWFPCFDHPGDRATQETIITVQQEYQAISNGKLVSLTKNDAAHTHTFHWLLEQPHPTYLSVLVAGPYVGIKDMHGSLPLTYWVYPEAQDDALRSFGKTPEILQFLENVYGVSYPWPRYDQITIPGIGGGAESTTATVVGESIIHDERADQDFSSHWLVAHEAAHHWWGNLVSYRDWTHTWLSESFATFSEYLWSRHSMGHDEGALNLQGKKEAYLREAREKYMRPIVFDRWEYPNQNFDNHTYPKGAVILNMLQAYLGEVAFQRVIKHFLQKHAFQSVETHDFLTAVKDVTGENLDWFFNQWLHSPGHPVFEIASSWNAEENQIRVSVAQVQDTTRGVPVFKTPVNIGITTRNGHRSEKVWLNAPRQTFTFHSNEAPLMIRFDEENVLLKEWTYEKSTLELLHQVKKDDAIGRAWAAKQLQNRLGEKDVVQTLKSSMDQDSFWAVRRQAIQSLATQVFPEQIAWFRHAASGDEHSKVRAAALHALASYERAALGVFFKERYDTDNSYVVQAAALEALGHTGDPQWMVFLESQLEVRSPRGVIRSAAEKALKMLGQQD